MAVVLNLDFPFLAVLTIFQLIISCSEEAQSILFLFVFVPRLLSVLWGTILFLGFRLTVLLVYSKEECLRGTSPSL